MAECHVRQLVPEHRGHVGARAPGLHCRVVRRIDLGEVGGVPEQPHVHQHEAAGKRRRVDGRVVDDRGVDLQAGKRRRAPQPLDDQADESVPIRIIDAAVRRHHGITERLAAGAGVGGRQLRLPSLREGRPQPQDHEQGDETSDLGVHGRPLRFRNGFRTASSGVPAPREGSQRYRRGGGRQRSRR